MNDILRWLAPGSRKHATEDELLRFLDGEMPRWHARRLRHHIEQCWACRSRSESMQSAILDFVEVRKRMLLPHVSLPNSPRDRFLRKLEELSQTDEQSWPTRLGHLLRRTTAPISNPVFAIFLIVVAVASAIVVVWQRNIPTVSPNELLDRAQVWDTNGTRSVRRGVIYQKLEIRTANSKFSHSVYRDIEGRRRPRKSSEFLKQALLTRASLSGGVNWEHPLSASDFRKWNQHLSQKKDAVHLNSDGTLTLKTSPVESDVREQSLTVRKADFHPVARHLLFRDLAEVEIAELSYDLLPWEAVDVAELFEPDLPAARVTSLPSRTSLSLPQSALDGAELRARLALNEIGADTSESIFLERTSDSVKVAGFVESLARKREIDDALAGIPLVSSSVNTFEGRSRHLHQKQTTIIREQDVVAQRSPLQTYLALRFVPSAQAIQFSRDLINEALQIDRHALALDSLEQRFPEATQSDLTPENRVLLQQLLRCHQVALLTAIQKQKELVKPYHSDLAPDQSGTSSETINTRHLLRLANQIRQLSADLLGSGDGQRSAEAMLAELAKSLDDCERVANGLTGTTATDSQKKF